MADQKIRRISELVGPRWSDLPRIRPGDILGEDFYILEFHKQQGRLGEFMLIHGRSKEGDEFVVTTGAQAVMSDLNRAAAQLPLVARFEQRVSASGRKYLVLV